MGMSRSQDDIGYQEAIESCRTWNAQTGFGRRERLPFFDDHTQIHQVSTHNLVSQGKYPSSKPVWTKNFCLYFQFIFRINAVYM